MEIRENVIEWITGNKEVTITCTQQKYITKLRALKAELVDFDMKWVDNPDGSICCHLPLECLKLGKKRSVELTDEQRAALAERLRAIRSE